jgi:hypothetical protein
MVIAISHPREARSCAKVYAWKRGWFNCPLFLPKAMYGMIVMIYPAFDLLSVETERRSSMNRSEICGGSID